MIALINFLVLLVSIVLFYYFYVLSVRPARLARRLGSSAYPRCGRYRAMAMAFEFLAAACYVVYFFYPLPLPLPTRFAWGWFISATIAILIALPSVWLMVCGMIDAGPETIAPRQEQDLYGGIYEKIRHPQVVGEVFLWWVIAFALNSLHLVIISLIWFPVFYYLCLAEEEDLVLRFGQPYLDYMARTGRFWPKRSPWTCAGFTFPAPAGETAPCNSFPPPPPLPATRRQ